MIGPEVIRPGAGAQRGWHEAAHGVHHGRRHGDRGLLGRRRLEATLRTLQEFGTRAQIATKVKGIINGEISVFDPCVPPFVRTELHQGRVAAAIPSRSRSAR
jgi:hypothetical protein